MRDAQEFLAGLNDSREVWYRGERVDSVVDHETLGVAARHAAAEFDLAFDPAYRSLAVTKDDAGREYSTFWQLPHDARDLRRRSSLIEASTAHGATLVALIREIGSDAVLALTRLFARDPEVAARIQRFREHCRDADLAVAVAQTDVKGDRSLRPAAPRSIPRVRRTSTR